MQIVCKYLIINISFIYFLCYYDRWKQHFHTKIFGIFFRFTYQTRPVRRKECCVSGTLSIPVQQYLIKWTSSVSHMEDMSFIKTTELALYIHQSIVNMHTRISVKLKYTVNLQVLNTVNDCYMLNSCFYLVVFFCWKKKYIAKGQCGAIRNKKK